jgi:hypothetical protein
MKPSKSKSTGASLNGSEPTGSSTDQTQTNSVKTTLSESASNRRSIPPEGYLPPHFAKLRSIMEQHKVELPFMAEIELIELIYEVWNAGFKERGKIYQ